MRFLLLLLFFSLTTTVSAKQMMHGPWAQVVRMKGEVTYDGKKLKNKDKIKNSGLIKTGRRSFVKILVGAWKNEIVIGPNSEMELSMKHDKKEKKHKHIYTFKRGLCRWISGSETGKKKGKIFTKNASFGVRGTDFILKYNPVLDESEIIVLDGLVNFKSHLNSSDQALIKKGQWGGLGGRFGKKIGKVMDLPKSALKLYNKRLNL